MQRIEVNLTKRFTQLSLERRKVAVLAVARQGPAGRDGAPGRDGTPNLTKICGVNISGHKAVTVDSNGKVIYADNTIPSHATKVVGVTITAALTNEEVTIVPSGEIIEPTFNWLPDLPVFLGPNGLLTQTVPSSGFSLIIGFPTSQTSLLVDIKTPTLI